MRPLWLGLLALPGISCTTSYVVAPAAGGRVALVSDTVVTLSADPAAWNANPSDLPKYMTPIWIEIGNQSSENLRVRYMDFALTDGAGFRYAAVNPYSGQVQVPGGAPPQPPPLTPSAPSTPPPAPAPPPELKPPTMNPSDTSTEDRGGWTDNSGIEESGTGLWGARVELARYGGYRGGPRAGVHVHVRPFHVYPHYYYRPWPHYFRPWPHFSYYYWPPYYGGYVYPWDYHYYPTAPSEDVVRLGLPEGVLQPGGHVAGFVYFQNAATRTNRLQLAWNEHATDGRSIGSVAIPLVVVED